MFEKHYIDVIAHFEAGGYMRPLCVVWADGRTFDIDRIIDCRHAPSLKAGGHGLRFTCELAGQRRQLFFDDGRWYIEFFRDCRSLVFAGEEGD